MEKTHYDPCPFCICERLHIDEVVFLTDDGERIENGLFCSNCGAWGPESVWNDRKRERGIAFLVKNAFKEGRSSAVSFDESTSKQILGDVLNRVAHVTGEAQQ